MAKSVSFFSWNVNGLNSIRTLFGFRRSKFQHLARILESYEWPKIVFLQETHLNSAEFLKNRKKTLFNNYECHFNFGRHASCGTGILIHKSLPFKCNMIQQDTDDGRYTIIKGVLYGEVVSLVSVYAPVGNGKYAELRAKLFDKIVDQNLVGISIIAGDFNAVMNKDLDRAKLTEKTKNNDELINFVNTNSLVDVWRVLPTQHLREFSYIGYGEEGGGSRIDTMFLSSTATSKIESMNYEYQCELSDHRPFSTVLKFDKMLIGRGYWKSKPYIFLDERFQKLFSDLWQKQLLDFKRQILIKLENNTLIGGQDAYDLILRDTSFNLDQEPVISNLNLDIEWWEGFKRNVVSTIKHFEKYMASEDNKRISLLREDYLRQPPGLLRDQLGAEMQNEIKIANIKDTYKTITDDRLYQERVSSAFFSKIKQVQANNFIENFEKPDGTILNDREQIHKCLNEQYENLYKRKLSDETNFDFFLNNLPKINNETIGAFTFNECRKAVFSFEDGKCPGLDGIRIEFYKKYFDTFGPFFVKFLNNCVENNCIFPKSWGLSALCLIPKGEVDIPSFSKMRPLSMLMNDYKILAKMVFSRIVAPTPYIINKHQTGGVPNANIQDNTLLIHLIILYYTNASYGSWRRGFIVSLDNEKAFDSVIRSFLWKVMDAFGYDSTTVNILKALYSESKTKIIFNNFLGDEFKVEGGVRQGCPLSATLYTIFIEPLAKALNAARYAEGLKLPSRQEVRLVQHSDDMTLLMNDERAVCAAMQIVNNYGALSGARINYNKSFIIHLPCVGEDFNLNSISSIPVLKKDSCKKILGILFGSDPKNYTNANWEAAYGKIRDALALWAPTELSLIGRVLVVNTMALSRVVYLLQTIEYNSKWTNEIYNKLIRPFLYPTKVFRRVQTLVWPKSIGGLGLCDLQSKFFSLHIRRIRNYYDRPDDMLALEPIDSILSFFLDRFVTADPVTKNVRIVQHSNTILTFEQMNENKVFFYWYFIGIKKMSRFETEDPNCGIFDMSPKSAYKFLNMKYSISQRTQKLNPLSKTGLSSSDQSKIWEKKIFCKNLDPKIQANNFRLIHGMHPSKAVMYLSREEKKKHKENRRLIKMGCYDVVDNSPPNPNARCDFCFRKYNITETELVEHIFKDCLVAHNVWLHINMALRNASIPEIPFQNEFYPKLSFRLDLTFAQNFIVSETLFMLWKNRNEEYYQRKGGNYIEVLSKIKAKLCIMSQIDRRHYGEKRYNSTWKKLNRVINSL